VTESGVPVWNVVIPEISHPPSVAFNSRLE
jgi:hypothetical protein